MAADSIMLEVDIGLPPDADAAELDQETRQLREELLGLDVSVTRPAAGCVPEEARAVEATGLGTLVVELGRAVLGSAVRAIAAWVARRGTRSVRLTLDGDTIELSNASQAEQERLLEAFLTKHADWDG
jgi:hypothetical protein